MDLLFKTALLRILGFSLFLSVSSWLFVLVEYSEEDNVLTKYSLLNSLYKSVASKYNMTLEEFNNFSSEAHEALSEPKPKWTYFASMEFVFQTITTIGYGYITPQTPDGQLLCIFVSLMGIPITLLTLKSVGELIVKRINVIVIRLERKIFKGRETKQVQTKSAVILFSVMMMTMVVYGRLLMYYKNWTYVQGVYFWFVTFTTIGFGDYVITVSRPISVKKLSVNNLTENKNESVDAKETTLKIFLGIIGGILAMLALCVVSSVINSIMAAIEEWRCNCQCPGCVPRKTQDHVDNKQNTSIQQLNSDNPDLRMDNCGLKDENASSPSAIEIN